MINPDQVRAQIEGNLVWGIDMALSEAFVLENGIAATSNFDSYRIQRNRDVPEIDVALIASDEPSTAATWTRCWTASSARSTSAT
jgi:isoquinoline 1-oxidoreductase subunit beta